MEHKYNFWPTLLDSYVYFKNHEEDESAFINLIDKLNGVKSEKTESKSKGIEFEGLINDLIDGKETEQEHGFNQSIVDVIYNKLKRCLSKQESIKGNISTKFGIVYLHGIFDYTFPEMIADLKTTSNYSLKTINGKKVKKFTQNFQHKFISILTDKKEFNYVITDFNHLYIENFKLNKELNEKTILEIEEFIQFIEHPPIKKLISQSKVFIK